MLTIFLNRQIALSQGHIGVSNLVKNLDCFRPYMYLERLNRHKNMPNSNKRDFQYDLILKFRFNILIHSLTKKREK